MNTKLNEIYREIMDIETTRIRGYNKLDTKLDDLLIQIQHNLGLIKNGFHTYNLITAHQTKSMMNEYLRVWEKYKLPDSFIFDERVINMDKPKVNMDRIDSTNLSNFINLLCNADSEYSVVDKFEYILYDTNDSYMLLLGNTNADICISHLTVMSTKSLVYVHRWDKMPNNNGVIFTDMKMG